MLASNTTFVFNQMEYFCQPQAKISMAVANLSTPALATVDSSVTGSKASVEGANPSPQAQRTALAGTSLAAKCTTPCATGTTPASRAAGDVQPARGALIL